MFGYQNPKERPAEEIAGAYRRNSVLFPLVLAVFFIFGALIATHCVDIYYNNIPEIAIRYPITVNNFNLLFIIAATFITFPLLYFTIGFLVFEGKRKRFLGVILAVLITTVIAALVYLFFFGALSY